MKKMLAAIAASLACLTAAITLGGHPVYAQKPVPTPAASAKPGKKMPPRDAKGRFIKASPSPAPAAKKLPARDAKGRFMKASPAPSAAPKKALPPRDAKGRFMKKGAAPASPAPKK